MHMLELGNSEISDRIQIFPVKDDLPVEEINVASTLSW